MTTAEEIKRKLDIMTIASQYGFTFQKPVPKNGDIRHRAQVNLIRDENTSSLDFFEVSQRYYDRGDASIRGDVIDLISVMENVSNKEAFEKAREMANLNNYNYQRQNQPIKKEVVTKQVKKIDFKLLSNQAKNELLAVKKLTPFCIVEKQDKNEVVLSKDLVLKNQFDRLFEATIFPTNLEIKFRYIFDNILGWSDFWNSPTIILKDRNGKVVDIVAYRPKDKETGKEIKGMKYHYKNFNQRGDRFYYPFQKEVEVIAEREQYIIIGEGLKNALNALIYGVPFLTIESTGNTLKLPEKLISKIKEYIDRGYGVATAFDGDEAGEKAYHDFLSLLGFDVENILNFNSNQDFVEHLRAD